MIDIVVLSTADWDHPLWTNKQHVAVSLVDEGCRVLYLESLGLRPAQATGRDIKRIAQRLWRGLRPPRRVRRNLWVCSPLVIPGVTRGFGLWLNRLSLSLSLRFSMGLIGFRRPWLWTYNPLTLSFLDLGLFYFKVYHAVDAVQEQPCMPHALIALQERRLCREVDQVFVTSPQLKRQLAPYSKNIRFDPNVADQVHFASAMDLPASAIPADLLDIPEPRVGFIGAVSSYKLDFSLIVTVARLHPSYNFVFVGPTGEGEPYTDTALLDGEPNIYLLGSRSYGVLPSYCAGFACGWLPLRLTPYTEAMFPMKFFEYMSAGLPIVATKIDALKDFSSVAWLCDGRPDDFSEALMRCLAGHGPDQSMRLAMAAQYTYKARTKRMLEALEAFP